MTKWEKASPYRRYVILKALIVGSFGFAVAFATPGLWAVLPSLIGGACVTGAVWLYRTA